MLNTKDAIATLAVKDLKAAAVFYEGALGFEKVAVVDEELIIYRSGNGVFNLYRSKFAGTNKATAISWEVGEDLEAIVTALKAKGVQFEHYDHMPGMTRSGDIHSGGGMKVVWLKDPDGNILNIVSG
ncbi:MAG: VOC family protein [Rhodoferax sp.]|nr:VOC family protein [Rhodoferax sp.]